MTKLEAWLKAADLVKPILANYSIREVRGASNIFGNAGVVTPVEQYINHIMSVGEWLIEEDEKDKEPNEELLPNLGMATTHELLLELATRMDLEHAQKGLGNCEEFAIQCRAMIFQLSQDGQEVLNYRTYDS